MSVENKYVKHAYISEVKFRQIILSFSEDLSATQISHLTKISRPKVKKYLTAIRLRILELSLLQSPRWWDRLKSMRIILTHDASAESAAAVLL